MAHGTCLRPACLAGSVASTGRLCSTVRRLPPTLCGAKTSRRGLYFGARHEGEGSDVLGYSYGIFVPLGFDARRRQHDEPVVRASPTNAPAPTARKSPERGATPWNNPRRPPVPYTRRSQSAPSLTAAPPFIGAELNALTLEVSTSQNRDLRTPLDARRPADGARREVRLLHPRRGGAGRAISRGARPPARRTASRRKRDLSRFFGTCAAGRARAARPRRGPANAPPSGAVPGRAAQRAQRASAVRWSLEQCAPMSLDPRVSVHVRTCFMYREFGCQLGCRGRPQR
jgi:hypothetical protein